MYANRKGVSGHIKIERRTKLSQLISIDLEELPELIIDRIPLNLMRYVGDILKMSYSEEN